MKWVKLINSFMKEVLSCRNQSINLQNKSIDWFLCDRDLRQERVKLIRFDMFAFDSTSGNNLN